MLEDFCANTGIFSGADSLKNYDNIVKNIGTANNFCHSSKCECKLPGATNYNSKWKNHDGTGTETTVALTHNAAGVMKI